MFRLILLTAVIALAVYLVKRLYFSNQASDKHSEKQKPAALMQKCAQCEVHIPKEQGLIHQNTFFCCEQHRDDYFANK